MHAATASYTERWAESREYLRLCSAALHYGRYRDALNWLHEAHNLGRDNIILHASTHLRYVRFSLHDSDYRRALGHIFWAMSSPFMVPIDRRKRTATIGDWAPAPGKMASGPPPANYLERPIIASLRAEDGR